VFRRRHVNGTTNAFPEFAGPLAGTATGKDELPFAVAGPRKFREERLTPNQVSLARILIAFAAVALFSWGAQAPAVDLTALLLTVTAIALDGVDGYLARTRGLATPFGAKFDILGDRVVENSFFTCFAASGLISLWVPVLFFARGALTDFLCGLANQSGRNGRDHNPLLKTSWAQAIVNSRISRASYATLKCVCFCYLGLVLSVQHMQSAHLTRWSDVMSACWSLAIAHAITLATTIFCVVRAVPVLWEGRRYFSARPRTAKILPVAASR
jgi:CDP-diacylglycerol--glycerol-3-phosphate 3-phosphatidyltransferase